MQVRSCSCSDQRARDANTPSRVESARGMAGKFKTTQSSQSARATFGFRCFPRRPRLFHAQDAHAQRDWHFSRRLQHALASTAAGAWRCVLDVWYVSGGRQAHAAGTDACHPTLPGASHILRYSFNEGAGATVRDDSGVHQGAVEGTLRWSLAERAHASSAASLQVRGTLALPFVSRHREEAFSVTFKTTNNYVDLWQNLYSLERGDGEMVAQLRINGTHVHYSEVGANSTVLAYSCAWNVLDGRWHSAVVLRGDPEHENDTRRHDHLFLDGHRLVRVGEAPPRDVVYQAAAIRVGSLADGTQHFVGLLDELAYYPEYAQPTFAADGTRSCAPACPSCPSRAPYATAGTEPALVWYQNGFILAGENCKDLNVAESGVYHAFARNEVASLTTTPTVAYPGARYCC